jgi:hypothetical protein
MIMANLNSRELIYRKKIIAERHLNHHSQHALDILVSKYNFTYKFVYKNFVHPNKTRYFKNIDNSDLKNCDIDILYHGCRRLTNFDKDRLSAYQSAICQYMKINDMKINSARSLFIAEIAPYFSSDGLENLDECNSLWVNDDIYCDLSDFWNIYNRNKEVLFVLGIAKPYIF